MPHPLYVAFVWHQHQPLYKSRGNLAEGAIDPTAAQAIPTVGAGLDHAPDLFTTQEINYRLPWVRLHGTKDYLDLVQVLAKYPKLHQTVNLVPSLILQIEDYVAGRAIDPYLALALKPIDQFDQRDRFLALEHFFDGNHRTLVDPHPRYRQLFEQRQDKGIGWCVENWGAAEFGDLMAWHNLAWIDPLFWDDPQVATWLNQDRDFSLADRVAIWQKQRQILAKILPQHRAMQEAAQLEVTTTPYTHPILPLLADTDSGRVAVPNMDLPEARFAWPEDIPRHLDRAVQMYRERFGRSPRGLWPSEESVSPAILSPVAAAGFQWLISDEAVLGWTLHHFFHRDGLGNVQDPRLLYQPYRLATPEGDLAIVFRDHRLSDLVGFTYAGMDAATAAADLVGHLEAIGRNLTAQQEGGETSLQEPWLVTIALDGENCWEYYDRDGLPFLERLYGTLSDHPDIQLVTVAEYLDRFPPRATLPSDQLHSGSWVDGSFTTWIGDPAKNRAWDLLGAARDTLAHHPEATEAANPAAWEALYAAEGSDWFWWFGVGHSSNQDAIFDRLFREHVAAIYQALDEPIPAELFVPVDDRGETGDRTPLSFIHPIIDGCGDEQDWNSAGRVEVGGARGTMHQAGLVQRVWYGVDHLHFYLRVDFKSGVQPGHTCPPELHLLWYYRDRTGINSRPPLGNLPETGPASYFYRNHLGISLVGQSVWLEEAGDAHHWKARPTRAQARFDRCLEVAVPWADLPVEPDYQLDVAVLLGERGQFRDAPLGDALVAIGVP